MFVGMRSARYSSCALLVQDDKTTKLSAKFGHTTWHPSGRVAAYSIYDVHQFFHCRRDEVRNVVELDSSLAYYSLDRRKVQTTPAIADIDRLETHPCWGPEGRWLYFASGPVLWQDRHKIPPDHYDQLQYDIMRIPYDVETDQWGELETVLSAKQTGLSILQPRVSPDGRFLLVTMCGYSCFALFQPDSDLYLMDLKTGAYRQLDQLNSDQAESWHCFSSNSRWIVFSSKRPEGLFTRVYFSYMDRAGHVHKPFILPQKDPTFYDSSFMIYNVPELITGPITISRTSLAHGARSSEKLDVGTVITGATPQADTYKPGSSLRE